MLRTVCFQLLYLSLIQDGLQEKSLLFDGVVTDLGALLGDVEAGCLEAISPVAKHRDHNLGAILSFLGHRIVVKKAVLQVGCQRVELKPVSFVFRGSSTVIQVGCEKLLTVNFEKARDTFEVELSILVCCRRIFR